jgi:hypothetical protein
MKTTPCEIAECKDPIPFQTNCSSGREHEGGVVLKDVTRSMRLYGEGPCYTGVMTRKIIVRLISKVRVSLTLTLLTYLLK